MITLKGLYPFLSERKPLSDEQLGPPQPLPRIEIPPGWEIVPRNLFKYLSSPEHPFDPFDGQVKLVFQEPVLMDNKFGASSRSTEHVRYLSKLFSPHVFYHEEGKPGDGNGGVLAEHHTRQLLYIESFVPAPKNK